MATTDSVFMVVSYFNAGVGNRLADREVPVRLLTITLIGATDFPMWLREA
jgi:hypothetical protein